MGWLDGYSAIVTGAASGIGRAVVDRFLAEGASVVAVDRDADKLEALADRAATVVGDVRESRTHEQAVALAQARYGKLDVLVGNAGVFDYYTKLERYTPELLERTFDELFAINVKGYLLAALAAREALARTRGAMIFTASIAGFHPGGGGVVYTAAKHAVVGLVRQLALECAPAIRVNGVGPGGTLTDLRGTEARGQAARSLAGDASLAQAVAASIPLGFAQHPSQHTGLYVLLASRENAPAVTGEVFMSDGGVGVRGFK